MKSSWGIAAPAIFVIAALASAWLIVVLKPWLQRYALARPNARSSHREPTPQGAGIAVVAATIGTAWPAVEALGLGPLGASPLPTLFAACVVMACVGATDDIRPLPVAPRLLLQAIAVVAVVQALAQDVRVVPLLPFALERALLAVGGLWLVNLVNFMDGIDWMTVAEFVPVTAGLAAIGFVGALSPHAIVVAIALGGALVGFAYFNRPVARLFLGDVGSLPIGLLLAWLLIVLAGNGHWAAAVLLPLYYLADASITRARRILGRERIWEAHRSHFYQRAVDGGRPLTDVVARVFGVNVVLAALALLTVMLPGAATDVGTLAAGGALVAWLLAVFARGRR
jgi:UDP-N-acetylmuramyl pentapeptide phosphotransferase/UDP-N-acetylglucosamine-1-phosphate transferase